MTDTRPTEAISHTGVRTSDDLEHFGRLLWLSLPVVIITLSRTVMSFVDFVMVSQLGTAAQAAIMPANLVMFCLIAVGMGTMTAVTTFASQALGRGRPPEAAAYCWQALWFSLAAGLLTLPIWWICPAIVALWDHEPDVAALEVIYARIILLSVGPSTAAAGLAYFFIGIQRPWVATWAAVLANLVNLIADYALIFGHFGLPAMGIAGAAWATVIGVCVRLAVQMAWFVRPAVARTFAVLRTWRPDARRLGNLLGIGMPTGMTFLLELAAWTVFTNWLVARFGTPHLAASNIIFQYLHISFMPAVGVGIALCSVTGKAIGQRRFDLVYRHTYRATALCVGWMGLCGLAFWLFRYPLMDLLSDEPAVIAIGARLMLCAAVFQVADGVGIAATNALRGAGDTLWPSVYFTFYAWVIMIGGGFAVAAAVPQWQSLGPWVMSAAYIILLGVHLWVRFIRGSWRRIDIFGEAGAPAERTGPAADLPHPVPDPPPETGRTDDQEARHVP